MSKRGSLVVLIDGSKKASEIKNEEKLNMANDYEQEQHERAFREGVEEGQNAGFWDDFAHEVGNAATVLIPETTEHQSHEAGYEEGRRRRTGW